MSKPGGISGTPSTAHRPPKEPPHTLSICRLLAASHGPLERLISASICHTHSPEFTT
ncbi:hypothetical protein PAXRUDRAFT_827333 [Paxillus rubicundulus Ve08.2h10]|uniref:Uncharacterized protein n=1 Tax=Paxillus rubicundulus Ve08.2h10 TaxID=930991 RepID=A0A0D0DCX8_9AGAM|nr:hypothetical protein PAXRUDRAFT_827333 [Paxillus rubicundulus Ve08.2h10]